MDGMSQNLMMAIRISAKAMPIIRRVSIWVGFGFEHPVGNFVSDCFLDQKSKVKMP